MLSTCSTQRIRYLRTMQPLSWCSSQYPRRMARSSEAGPWTRGPYRPRSAGDGHDQQQIAAITEKVTEMRDFFLPNEPIFPHWRYQKRRFAEKTNPNEPICTPTQTRASRAQTQTNPPTATSHLDQTTALGHQAVPRWESRHVVGAQVSAGKGTGSEHTAFCHNEYDFPRGSCPVSSMPLGRRMVMILNLYSRDRTVARKTKSPDEPASAPRSRAPGGGRGAFQRAYLDASSPVGWHVRRWTSRDGKTRPDRDSRRFSSTAGLWRQTSACMGPDGVKIQVDVLLRMPLIRAWLACGRKDTPFRGRFKDSRPIARLPARYGPCPEAHNQTHSLFFESHVNENGNACI